MPTGVGTEARGRPSTLSSAPWIEPMDSPSMFGSKRVSSTRPGAIIARARRRLGEEHGFTFPELAVTMAVALIVVAAVMGFIVVALHQWQNKEERVSSIDESRNALQKVVAELRDANPITVVNGQTVDATIRSGATTQTVRYACSAGTCTRTTLPSGTTVQLATEVTNTDNFTRVTDSAVVGADTSGRAVLVKFANQPDGGENPIVLQSAVYPRNCTLTPSASIVNPPC